MGGTVLRISVHILWISLAAMQTTIIDSPHEKSIKFLKDVCKMDGIELLKNSTIYNITVRVRGRSGRHYEVVASRPIGLFSQEPWKTTVVGAAWKGDFDSEKTRSFTANLCLNTHEEKRHLPVGDRLASLVLSLHNDIKLAMDIPLVAQFIVCPREDLFYVYTFQDDMVVTQDMIDEQQAMNDEYDYFDEDELDDFGFDETEWQAPALEEPTEPEPMQRTWGHDFGDFLIQHIEESRSSS